MQQIRTFLVAIGAVLAVFVGGSVLASPATAAVTATVAGTVTVPAGSSAGSFVSVLNGSGVRLRGGLVDDRGTYRITGVPAGRVTLRFEPDPVRYRGLLTGYYGDTTRAADAEIVDLAPGEERTGLDHTFLAGHSISGTVRERGTGAPVQGYVIATPRRAGDPVKGAVAKPDGSYRLTGLVDGGYVIGFSYRQIAGPIGPIAGYYEDADTVEEAEVVSVAGGDLTGIDTSVPTPPLSISGRVLDVDGEPIAGVNVAASGTVSGFSSATTGADGRYRIAGMPAGSYTVEFAGYDPRFRTAYFDGAATKASATTVTVANGVHRTDVDARLREKPHVRGTVTDAATGEPVPWARVYLLSSDGRLVAGAEADADGRYLVGAINQSAPDVPDPAVGGPHKIVFVGPGSVLPPESGAGPTYGGLIPWAQVEDYVSQYYDGADRLGNATVVDLPEDGGVAGIDGALERGGSITGSIERSAGGGSVAYVYVTAYAADGQPVGETQTDEDGNYVLRSLAPGDYRVRFASASARGATSDPAGTRYYRSAKTRAGAEPVTVARGQATALGTVDLESPPSISGRVTVAGTGTPPVTPLTTAYLYRWEGIVATVVDTTFVSTVDGSYRFGGIAPGRYSVGFGGGGYGSQYVGGTPSGVGNVEEATRFDLEAGEDLGDVDAELRGDARIVGTVTLGEGAAVRRVAVVARDAETGDELRTMDTGPDGAYSIPGLTPGVPVVLEFRPPSSVNALGGFYGGDTFATATPVVPGASPQVADYALTPAPPAASVSGTVVFGGWGDGVIGATAHLSDGTRSWTATIESETTHTGSYRFAGLPAGRYELRIEAPNDPTMMPRPADEIVLEAVEERTVSPIVLEYGAIVAGRARTVGGGTTGLAGVTVELIDTNGTTATATATTDASGDYRIGPVPAGNYRLRFDPSGVEGSFLEQYHPRRSRAERALPLTLYPRSHPSAVDAALVTAPSQAPTITGRPVVGQYPRAAGGTWAPTPSVRAYRWFACPSATAALSACEHIGSQEDIKLRDTHLGRFIELEETVTVEGVEAAFRSRNRIGPVTAAAVPTVVSPPTITGSPVVYGQVSSTPGSWTHAPGSYRYAWYRCAPSGSCAVISSATDSYYKLSGADVGHELELGVAGWNADGYGVEARSARSAVVPPRINRAPTVDGTPREGERLVGTAGTWIGNDVTVERQWLRCDAAGTACVPVDGATAVNYVLGVADAGHTLRLREVAAKNGGVSEPADSAATAVVTVIQPTNTGAPSVEGTARVGSTLTASDGNWAPAAGPFTYERRWLRCIGADCTAIGGAVGETYALTAGDLGKEIAVEVRATRLDRSSEWARSPSVGPALPPVPTIIGAPSLHGSAVRDQTLGVTDGSWSHAPTAYEYRWLFCTSTANCGAIGGATENRYRLSAADVGQRIAAEVRASNAGGASAWVRTELSAVVTAPRDPDPDPDPPTENPPTENPPSENPPGDKPPGEKPPTEKPPGDKSPPGGGDAPGGSAPKPVTAARVSVLRLQSRGTRLQLRFRGGSKVRTTVTVSSQKALPIRGKRQVVRIASTTLTSPRTTTVRLSALAREALRGRRSLPVTVRIAPRGGKAVTQRLTLRVG